MICPWVLYFQECRRRCGELEPLTKLQRHTYLQRTHYTSHLSALQVSFVAWNQVFYCPSCSFFLVKMLFHWEKRIERKNLQISEHTSSRLKAFALGLQEWFIQLCKGKNAVPFIKDWLWLWFRYIHIKLGRTRIGKVKRHHLDTQLLLKIPSSYLCLFQELIIL